MSNQDDPHYDSPDDACPVPADDDWGPEESPSRGGFGNYRGGYGESLPSSYSELHGEVRKGQKPPPERD